jgi:hypothetical protein
LTTLVNKKKEKNKVLLKDTNNLRKEVRILEKDCEDLKRCKDSIVSEVKVELELID